VTKFVGGLRLRLVREEGAFTLIELLIVLVIIGILLVIAVPSYVAFKDRASKSAAKANVREAVPAINSYGVSNGNYSGMTFAALQALDAGVKVTIVSTGGSTFCVRNTQGNFTYYKSGPSGDITATACT
jgi:prepilin-type N-terminal cleavage/methylation domain-containing protein